MASVFLSHSSRDKPFVRELYRRLQRDGVTCFYDEESIGWGANFVRALEKGIDECEYFVVVLSPDFLASKWAEIERTSAMADDPAGLTRKILPLMLVSCRDNPGFPRFLRPIQAIDISTHESRERNYPRICKLLGGTLHEDWEEPRDHRSLPAVAVELPRDSAMPHRSLGERFVGRVTALWDIRDSLTSEKTAVVQGVGLVTGTGGLGKTQLAIEYAHRFGLSYPGGVFWVEAEQGLAQLVTTIARARRIEVDSQQSLAEQVRAIWRHLAGPSAVLVILDNFPETGSLQPWLPPTGPIHVLVTTRRRDLTQYKTIGLKVLTPDEGIELLNTGQRRYGSEAALLVEAVGGLPLALELLRSYLDSRPDVTPAALREALDDGEAVAFLEAFAGEYLDELPTGHEKGVLKTFALSWELASEPAQRLLTVMAYLAPVSVPRHLLRAILEIGAPAGLNDPLRGTLTELRRLSLVEFETDDSPIAHRLIMGFARYRGGIDAALQERIGQSLLDEMARVGDEHDTASLKELEVVAPHAVAVLHRKWSPGDEEIKLASRIGSYYLQTGRPGMARDLLRAALASARASYAPGHPEIAIGQSNLALALKDLGELQEARELLQASLASEHASYTLGHPAIAIGQSNLATVLRDLGELREARELLQTVLASAQASYAPGHPTIATSQSNLALVLQDLGELNAARELLQTVLASAQASYAPGHPTIATSQSNLALVLKDLGELNAARELLQAALASAQASYAPGHPTIAIRQSNLALVLQDLGELQAARDLLQAALASAQASHAPGHPSIATSQSNLALVLKNLGELQEARNLLQASLSSDQASYAPGHPSIAIRQSNLAMVLKNLGELQEARDLLQASLASAQASYAPGHPTIATGQSNLALVLQDLGELQEARDLLQAALASDQASYAPGHPSIAIGQSNLAGVLRDLGELNEARDLLQAALASAQASYAPGHPSIATRQSNLAGVLQDLGELEEARELLEAALASLQMRFSPDHPSVKTVQANLTAILRELETAEHTPEQGDVAILEEDSLTLEPLSTEARRVLHAAVELSGDPDRARHWYHHEALSTFDGQTAERLVTAGRVEDVLRYITSLHGGVTG